jgi:phage-related minor tail protein
MSSLSTYAKSLTVEFGNALTSAEYTTIKSNRITDRKGTFTLLIARAALSDFNVWAIRDASRTDFTCAFVLNEGGTLHSTLNTRGQITGIDEQSIDGDSGGRSPATSFLVRPATTSSRSSSSTSKAGTKEAKGQIDDVTKSTGASTQAFKAQSDALAQLIGKIDPTVSSLGKLDDQLESLKKFKASGAISGEDFATYAGKIGIARDELTKVSAATHGFGLQTNLAQREVTVLLGELARGNTARFESSLITLGRASGVLGLALSGAGAGVIGFGAIIAGIAVAYEKGAAEQDAFNRGLVSTGNYAGVTTGQLFQQAQTLGAATGHYNDAQEALTKLAGAGKLTGDTLNEAAKGAVALSVLTGDSIDKTVEEFNKLGEDPVKAVVALNDKYHFLTLAIYDQIKALAEQGDQEAATSLAVKTAADALDQRRQTIVDNAGAIEKAWLAVKGAVQGAIDNLKQVGRSDIDAQLSNAYAKQFDLQSAQNQINAGGFQGFLGRLNAGPQGDFQKERDDNNALIASLQALKKQQEDNADFAAHDDSLQQRAIKSKDALDSLSLSLDKNAAKQKALNDLHNQFETLIAAGDTSGRLNGVTADANGNISGGDYDRLKAAIEDKFKEKAGPKAHDTTVQANSDLQALSNYADELAAKVGGPLDEAWQKYQNELTHINQLAERAVTDNQSVTKTIEQQNRAVDNATAGYLKNVTAIKLKAEQQANAGWDKDAKALADYSLALDDQLERMQAQIDAGGEITAVQEAEFAIQQKLHGASQLEKDDLKTTTDDILKKAAALDQLRAKTALQNEILGTLNSLIEGTRQGFISGDTALDALGKTAAQVLPSVANDFLKIIENLKKANGGTLDFGKALDGLGDTLEKELPALGQLVGTIAGGGGNGAQIGSAIGSIAGAIIGTYIGIGPAAGGAIGGIIGGVIGGQGDGHGTPAVYGSSRPGSVGRDGTAPVQTPLGIFAADTNNLSDDAYKAFEATVKGFDQQLARLFSPEQLASVQTALDGFSGKFSDINSLLAARFATILGALDPAIKDFVTGFASDLQGQVQALADTLQLQKLGNAGLLITDTFGDALNVITEFAQAGESVLATYNRLVTSTVDYQQALTLMGLTFDGSKTQLVEFAQNIADAVGSTAEADTLWKKFFKDFYSTAELTASNITLLQTKSNDTLSKIGLTSASAWPISRRNSSPRCRR